MESAKSTTTETADYQETVNCDDKNEHIENNAVTVIECEEVTNVATNYFICSNFYITKLLEYYYKLLPKIRLRNKGEKLPQWYIILLSLSWMATSAVGTLLLLLVVPIQIIELVGEEYKGTVLGITYLFSSLSTLIIIPIVGLISDRFYSPFGRRKPFILLFTLLSVICILLLCPLSTSSSLLVFYIIIVTLQTMFDAASTTTYQSLMPDIIAIDQMGEASGWFALQSLLGDVIGGSLYGIMLAYYSIFFVLCVAVSLVVITTLIVLCYEEPVNYNDDNSNMKSSEIKTLKQWVYSIYEPFTSSKAFVWATLSRFFVLFGFSMLTTIAYYYLLDVIQDYNLFGYFTLSTTVEAATLQRFVLLITGAICSIIAGKLADIVGRIPIALIGASLHAYGTATVVFVNHFNELIISSFILGAGIGIYRSSEMALINDIVPRNEAGRYIGIWALAWNIAQLISAPITGFLIDHLKFLSAYFNISHFEYRVVFAISAFFMALGAIALLFIGSYDAYDATSIITTSAVQDSDDIDSAEKRSNNNNVDCTADSIEEKDSEIVDIKL